ncbi:transcription factor bHLH128-like isoform X2 [Chenopodium quinoa]|uniref:transcription factor bHLH128-like isoform X2 n=1 Tax=Chenopodium quinoa TaxID=63459 RepID=UPI000B7873E1|nr:transcription factor bHLH128-like isoform X2 [Chenopodium quinoa]
MYSSSSSSQQQQSSSNSQSNNNNHPNLMRYDSAPSSLLSNTVDSIVGNHHHHHNHQIHQHHFFESNQTKLNSSRDTLTLLHQGPYGLTKSSSSNNNSNSNNNNAMDSTSKTTSSSNLIRHSSSPAGFLSHLASDIGFDVNYNNGLAGNSSIGHDQHMLSRLGSQLSFTRKDHHSLSQISEVNESVLEGMSSHGHDDHERKRSVPSQSRSPSGFSLTAWDDSNENNFVISTSSNKRGKTINDDILNGLGAIDSQQAMALEMATMERLMRVPENSVPCKIRAKRGFATHPRSIAERERRTRISGKLKKLQELVPNMDKQTSYSDMLDLAVQHIKGLQGQIEKLNEDLDHCTCGCKPNN